MAYPTVDSPYGLKPVNLIGGQVFAGSTRMYNITYAYGTDIFYGDFVALVRGNRGDAEVIQDEQVKPRQLRQAFAKAAVTVGHMQLLQQARRAGVEHREAQARGLLPQRTSEPRLAATGVLRLIHQKGIDVLKQQHV